LPKFSELDPDSDYALIISYDAETDTPIIEAYTQLPADSTSDTLSSVYLSACDFSEPVRVCHEKCKSNCKGTETFVNVRRVSPDDIPNTCPPSTPPPTSTSQNRQSSPTKSAHHHPPENEQADVFVKKKYKPVAKKVRPVAATLPDKFRIVRNIDGDPLADMPTLDPVPPPFQPTGRYTEERKEGIDKAHPEGFLWDEERNLMHDFMCKQNEGFAWNDSERGSFRTDFFPPVEFPVIPHEPWIQRNIPIPPGIYNEVCKIVKTKIAAGVYEPSNSSYRSRWFCVLKKDGKSLRAVHSLEPLNAVTIAHSGVTPIPDHLAERFAGRACGAMFDLYVGYDERLIAESSRDLTTFQTPYGALRLVTLPMGWTNSVPIFHDDVTFILQPEIPDFTIPYIDDVPVKGPPTRYIQPDGSYETIPENPKIRRFVWEHFQNLNRIVQRMKYCGGTFSAHKLALCVPEIIVVGHRCTYEGRLPDESKTAAVVKWGPCKDLSEVRAFLGTIGVLRIFIRNFAHRAHHLVKLTRKDTPFEFGPDQLAAQADLKEALITSPALRPINYDSTSPVILAVDTSYIAVGYFLCQCDPDDPRKRYYSRFGSITLNDREARFSQPKLELYGLYRALRALRLYVIGVRNLIIEVDARYIRGMINNPDIAPNASMNRWIIAILMFHFTLVHVPGTLHGPDGLSRRPRQPDDDEVIDDSDEFEDWIDRVHSFVHIVNKQAPRHNSPKFVSTFVQRQDLSGEEEDDRQSSFEDSYEAIPRSDAAKAEDERILKVKKWLVDLQRPNKLTDAEFSSFIRYCVEFFVDSNRLWRKDPQGAHKIVAPPSKRMSILRNAHDAVGHKGFYATRAHILERFWWPSMQPDVQWFIRTCHLCQLRSLRKILIPPVVATPAPLFTKIYVDTMHMPPSQGFKYIVQGRCSLCTWPEFRMLRKESAKALADWIFEDILCRWGSLREIVTDNGPAFVKALAYLSKKYKINHIRISGYNSRANGIVERPHFDVRQSLYKVADGDQKRWALVAFLVFWAERITVRRRMGCSPYFAVTGAHPIIPLDIIEATYLLPAPDSVLSSTDLIARRAIALQKRSEDLSKLRSTVFDARRKAAARFEKKHHRTIRDYDFHKGDLVLVRNTQIEKALNRKMRARYTGPVLVVSRNYGGAYILCELDGSVFHRPVAAFRLIPYLARRSIPFPDNFIDIDTARLRELEETDDVDDDFEPPDVLSDDLSDEEE